MKNRRKNSSNHIKISKKYAYKKSYSSLTPKQNINNHRINENNIEHTIKILEQNSYDIISYNLYNLI